MRVLHVIPSVSPKRGGPSKAIVSMVHAINQAGHVAEIATTTDDCENTLDVQTHVLLDFQGVPTRFFPRWSPPIRSVREFAYAKGFSSWLRKHISDYDLIHVHALFSYCSTQTMRIARAANVPYVLRPLGLLQDWSLQQSPLRKKLFLSAVERKNIGSAAAIHCTSAIEEVELEKRFKIAKVINLPLAVELPKTLANAQEIVDQKLPIDRHQPTLLFMSRLHPKKGLEITLEALKKLVHQPWQLVVAGDGDPNYVQTIKTRISDLELDARCHLIGHVEGDFKQALLQTSDLFILCSHTENFGIAVAEAMANGLTPLVSEEVALASEIKEKKLGYVCKLTLDDLASKIKIALDHPEQRQKLGHNASHYAVDKFSWPQIADQLNQIYLKITE